VGAGSTEGPEVAGGIPENDPTASPYVLCARAAVDDFNAFAIGEGQRENIEYVFEKKDEEDKLRRHFAQNSYQEPIFRWSKPVERKGIMQKPFIGLQAAGWIVWEHYMDFARWFDKKFAQSMSHPDRWAMKVFSDHRQIPGDVKILYKSSPFLHWLSNHELSMTTLAQSMEQSIARLEAAKIEGPQA
jgi:hypothetical protein